MKDWNAIVCVYQESFKRALRALREFGSVERSPFYNVLLVKAEDPAALLEAMEARAKEHPSLYDAISRIAPAMCGFDFDSPDDFRQKAKSVVVGWAPQLAGRSFHVRFHRRGAACDLPTPDVERFLNDALLETLRRAGTPGSVSFSDPDAVIAVDTVDDRAGMGLWTRADLERHRLLLRPD